MIPPLSHPIFNIFPQLYSQEILFTNRYKKFFFKHFEKNVKKLYFSDSIQ
jgi:hypothetical protein